MGNRKRRNQKPVTKTFYLTNPVKLRKFLAVTMNEVKQGLITPEVGGKIAYLAQTMLKVFEYEDLSKRIKSVEDTALKIMEALNER